MSEQQTPAKESDEIITLHFRKWPDKIRDFSEIELGRWIFILLKDMPYEKVEAITKMICTFHLQQHKLLNINRGDTNN